jgi:subtilisin family serine protease
MPDSFGASYGGHGLRVASVAAALADSDEGRLNVRLRGYWSFLHNIPRMVDDGVSVISISALYSDRPRLREYVKYALASGVVVVAAAGNFTAHGAGVNYPAAYFFEDLGAQVLAVTATDDADQPVSNLVTSPGSDPINDPEQAFIDVAAPGIGVRVLDVRREDGEFVYSTRSASGTSLSTPMVSALAALLLTVQPDLSVPEVYDLITQHADRVEGVSYDESGWSRELGYGRINAGRSIEALIEPKDVD